MPTLVDPSAAQSQLRAVPESYPALYIGNVWPEIDAGRWPIKRVVGDSVEVWADIFKEGHDLLVAHVLYRTESEVEWNRAPMVAQGDDRWRGSFATSRNTRYRYTVEAFSDVWGSWRADLEKRITAGQAADSELLEGRRLIVEASRRAAAHEQADFEALVARWDGTGPDEILPLVNSPDLTDLMLRHPDAGDASRFMRELEVVVDRERARFGAWYEIFPRSQGTDPTRSATFREAEAGLPRIADLGFDVVYMTPIHPIGTTHRKGRNNSLVAGADEPGSPYAIGAEAGGHCAIAPELGTVADFRHFQETARDLGMELAMDFAIQVSPDHPWVREHPDWFNHRPDGSIKFAENPPKKYEDIYPLNFRTTDWRNLWNALKDVVVFWAQRGVRIFRVDNPHTKPLAFWEWLINTVQSSYPDVVFLAEAFTRPTVMRTLAKAGFSQSYTYFTWRNTKGELTEYLQELTHSPMREYFRPNFFANTPDILPEILQTGGRPVFLMRLVLAATLSTTYGIYNGFELCESTTREPGSEYYLDSEMYQHKVWDWDRPGNITADVKRVNRIRRENPALHLFDNLRFFGSDNDQLLVYGKAAADLSSVIVVVVNLDPFNPQSGWLDVPAAEWGLADRPYRVDDLLNGESYTWSGNQNWVRLDPRSHAAHILRVHTPSLPADR